MAHQCPNTYYKMLQKGQHVFDTDVFKIILMQSSFVFDRDTQNAYADVSGSELPTANGYTVGGATLAGVALNVDHVLDRSNVSWNNVSWTVSGGPITASGAIVYNDSTSTGGGDDYTKAIVGYIDFNGAQTASDGSTFNIAGLVAFIKKVTGT